MDLFFFIGYVSIMRSDLPLYILTLLTKICLGGFVKTLCVLSISVRLGLFVLCRLGPMRQSRPRQMVSPDGA